MNPISDTRLIAFYLPQFHPIPENDAWWGAGFTEWRNVARARPLFPGHYQPHIPADLGFYDLRVPEVREAQAELARSYGIHGFCYYHYWFHGKRLLERPFAEVLESGKPNFPFCLCWANESWTRAWDGGEQQIILAQSYSEADDRRHIRELFPALQDRRYIRVAGRPLLLIYRAEDLPDAGRTTSIWREEAHKAGIGDLYLARIEGLQTGENPTLLGFDAAVEFAPDWRRMGVMKFRTSLARLLIRAGVLSDVYERQNIGSYQSLVQRMLAKPVPEYVRFRCATPGFDNSSRRSERALIITGSDPDLYRIWLGEIISQARQNSDSDERIVFVNAWNEWAEGNHLEPDQRFGHVFLKATADALSDPAGAASKPRALPAFEHAPRWKKRYWRGRRQVRDAIEILRHVTLKPEK